MRGMGKQTHKRLSRQIAAAARDALPRYDEASARWFGGDDYTLYLWTDKRTGAAKVSPVFHMRNAGPELTARIATRDEATRDWQDPLHPGWKVEG